MKYKYYILVACLSVFLSSCSDFLDTEPDDFLSLTYYETEDQLEYALAGVYDILGNTAFYGQQYICRMGNEADEGYFNREEVMEGPQVYNFSTSDNIVQGLWKILYDGINRANLVLASLEQKPAVDPLLADRIKGETLFLRAYYYFILVEHWGDVPLILSPTVDLKNKEVGRTPSEKVYEQIIGDMDLAEDLVQSATEAGFGGRVTKSAVRGILARVCLRMAGNPLNDESRYAEARSWAKKVIDDTESGHRLHPDYSQVFINYAQDKYDIKESIWEVEFWGNAQNSYRETGRVGAWLGLRSESEEIGLAYGHISATAHLYRLYDTGDLRRDWAIAPYTYGKDGSHIPRPEAVGFDAWKRYCGKWRREYETVYPRANNATSQNFPLLRYSDVLLMFAEADNAVNHGPTQEAYNAINFVRRRAFGLLDANGKTDLTQPESCDLSGLNETSFQEEIMNERSRELCFEALRKQDLIRWGKLVENMKNIENLIDMEYSGQFFVLAFRNVSQRHLLFPIPAREMILNKKLTQNPQW